MEQPSVDPRVRELISCIEEIERVVDTDPSELGPYTGAMTDAYARFHTMLNTNSDIFLSDIDPNRDPRERIEEAYKKAYLQQARGMLYHIETDPYSEKRDRVEGMADDVRDFLSRYQGVGIDDVDMSLLDETGQSTAEQIEERLNDAVKALHLRSARKILENFERGYIGGGTARGLTDRIHKMHDFLNGAEADVTALDETGQSSEQEMKARIEKSLREVSLTIARKEFKNFEGRQGVKYHSIVASTAQEIRALFEQAGEDASALDLSGEFTAAEMEERIDANVARLEAVAQDRHVE